MGAFVRIYLIQQEIYLFSKATRPVLKPAVLLLNAYQGLLAESEAALSRPLTSIYCGISNRLKVGTSRFLPASTVS